MKKATIVMYHYVRDLMHSRYPEIKGLDVQRFKQQLDYLQENYTFITMEEFVDAIDNGTSLPPKAVILTFDDAYIDHYTVVFPLLDERKIQGSFFVPVKAVTQHTVLDVNKIHFILASVPDKTELVREINNQLDTYRNEYGLESNDYYFDKLAHASRFDTKEVVFIKRMLQVELPEQLRNIICDQLFADFVGMSEETFSRELYMNVDQLKCMHRHGMHIGAHGYDHYWLGSLTPEQQRVEIEKGCNFLEEVRGNLNNWTMCYPYGNYNQSLIEILSEHDCKLGLTTVVDVADLSMHKRFELPRLDTNDLPPVGSIEKAAEWLERG